jgi:hypothetical protein
VVEVTRGFARKFARCEKLAVVPMREIQHPVRQHAAAVHGMAHLIGDGAQILADHHAAIALALERHDGQQVLKG